MWGKGYLIGFALAFIFWLFFLRSVDRDYYKRKAEILRKRKLKLEASRKESLDVEQANNTEISE